MFCKNNRITFVIKLKCYKCKLSIFYICKLKLAVLNSLLYTSSFGVYWCAISKTHCIGISYFINIICLNCVLYKVYIKY